MRLEGFESGLMMERRGCDPAIEPCEVVGSLEQRLCTRSAPLRSARSANPRGCEVTIHEAKLRRISVAFGQNYPEAP